MKYSKAIQGFEPSEGFRVITVGSGAPPQDLDRTPACTIVQYKDVSFVVDLGYAASMEMLKIGIEPSKQKNVLFTHLHSDHTLDYGYFLITGWHDGRNELNVVGPKGTKHMHDLYLEMFDEDISYRKNLGIDMNGILENVNFNEIGSGESFEWDGVKISTLEVPHTTYTLAYKFEADGQCVVVSADLKYYEPFIEFSKGAQLVVFDGNQANSTFLQDRGPKFVKNLDKSHATIPQIGEMAQKANVPSIMMTHLTYGTFVGELVQDLTTTYDGEIIVGENGMAIDVPLRK